jgi:N-methylhydantoinase B
MDDDGVNLGKHIPVKVRVEVRGDEMTVDLSAVAAQVAGFFNSGPTAGRSAVQVAFKCLTTPLLLPINDGALSPVKVVLPPGRVVSATKPASLRAWMTIPMTVVDTIFKALATACPERVTAGHHADLSSAYAYGFIDPSGRIYLARSGNVGSGNGGGWGAKLGEDGMPATVCINDGDTHNRPVEALEAKSSAVIVRRELWQDSGGAGKWRGGLGLRSEIRVLNPAMYQSRIERTICAPWGLLGGKDGLANRVGVIRADGMIERFPTGKVNPLRLEEGEGFITEMGGGGGFGDPLERPAERVLADVRSGYVSFEAARRDYRVVIRQQGRRFELDVDATTALRQGRSQ